MNEGDAPRPFMSVAARSQPVNSVDNVDMVLKLRLNKSSYLSWRSLGSRDLQHRL